MTHPPADGETPISDPLAIGKALCLAEAGEFDAAMGMLPPLLERNCRDVNILHRAGVVYKICGDLAQALSCFAEALRVLPHFHYTEFEIATVHWQLGNFDEARRWFAMAIASCPSYLHSYVTAAKFERERGKTFAALDLLERARSYDPHDPGLLEELARIQLLHDNQALAIQYFEAAISTGRARDDCYVDYFSCLSRMGCYEKLLLCSEDLPQQKSASLVFQTNVLLGHAMLARASDRDSLLARLVTREASAQWHTAGDVCEMLKQAIAERQPMSLLRLGDGEARFFAAHDPAVIEMIGPEKAAAIGNSIWMNWFGESLSAAPPAALTELHNALRSSIETADIIGLSTAKRLSSDHYHFGYLAYLDGYVTRILEMRRNKVADAFVNLELHRLTPFYHDLVSGLDFLGIISPHPDLAMRLGARLGIADTVGYVIPGETRLPSQSGLTRGVGHFPGRYHELLCELSVPYCGAVFLVAGGLLGKVYCHRIGSLGGIAIDIGSVADAWMGYGSTRPGQYVDDSFWKLP